MNKDEVTSNSLASDNPSSGYPFEVLEHYCDRKATGCLYFFGNQIIWLVRLETGKITYVTNSIEKFDRLICHLRYMSHQVPKLTKEFRAQVCMMFEGSSDASSEFGDNSSENAYLSADDYRAVCWLVTQQHLTYAQASQLAEGITREAIEPLFWMETVTYKFSDNVGYPLSVYATNLTNLALYCQQRLRLWQLLAPQIWSPYQRPYFFGQTEKQKQLLPELHLHQKFSTILKGFSFRHLAVLLNKDELKIAGSLMPYICEEVVVLRDPQPPFNLLPIVPSAVPEAFQKLTTQVISQQVDLISAKSDDTLIQPPAQKAHYTIACVDDSPTVLMEIGRFLDDESFKVVAIKDPLKALMQILRIKPDLILLDVTMPKVNGYELCRLIRKNNAFKHTPIVMVTGNTGIIDRAKAKISGATDYLTKPFTQEGLLKMVFRHLS